VRDGGTLEINRLPDTLVTRDELRVGETIRYAVTIPGGSRLNVYLAGRDTRLDTVLRLYDPTGRELLFENDNVSRRDVSSALEGLETLRGSRSITFVLEVSLSEAETVGGAFRLTLEADALDE
jgi:hypothetical protein